MPAHILAPRVHMMYLETIDPGQWTTQVEASLKSPAERHQVYVTLYGNNLVSQIQAGENTRRTLHHDFVVRQLAGPFPLAASGQWQKNLLFTLKPGWKANEIGVADFIQHADGEAIQALTTGLSLKSYLSPAAKPSYSRV